MTGMDTQIDIRRAEERFATKIEWLDSKHSFSFGGHQDRANTHHGLLLVNNDDTVAPGTGFETHPHRDMEIVTWVLQGSLVHQDSTGHSGVIYPGLAQRMSAGTGILHSEKNDSWRLSGADAHSDPVHFVQMWVVPDERGITPGYEQLEIDNELLSGGLSRWPPAWTGTTAPPPSASRTATRRCMRPACSPARASNCPTPPSCICSCPAARRLRGRRPARRRRRGARSTAIGGQRVTAVEPAEILVWEMHATLAA